MLEEHDNSHIPYIAEQIASYGRVPESKITPAGIKLRKWLMAHKMTVTQASRRCGFGHNAFRDYVCGTPRKYPTLSQAFAIEYLTNGVVCAHEWLDNPYVEAKIRRSQVAGANALEHSAKSFILKFNSMKTADGMIRQKARILARLYKVDWGEVKSRVWKDVKAKAKAEQYDLSMLLREPITQEEHDEQAKADGVKGG